MNANPNAKRILVFGDYLSWGYIPGSKHERYASNIRWPGKLQEILGNDYEVIEEALNSRGIESGDPRPGKEGRKALDYIIPCLDSHDPLDFVIILLGTNELKYSLNLSAEQIADQMRQLLEIIVNRPSQFRPLKPKVILLAPPSINEQTEYCSENNKYKDAFQKSKKLSVLYENLAKNLNIKFFDLDPLVAVGIDGIHLDKQAHKTIAEKLAEIIKGNQ
jgi:lysophospholipase L1-like esterase